MAKESIWLSEEKYFIIIIITIKEYSPWNIFSLTFSIWTVPCSSIVAIIITCLHLPASK